MNIRLLILGLILVCGSLVHSQTANAQNVTADDVTIVTMEWNSIGNLEVGVAPDKNLRLQVEGTIACELIDIAKGLPIAKSSDYVTWGFASLHFLMPKQYRDTEKHLKLKCE